MDILCKFCREPWDTDTLHEVAEEHAGRGAITCPHCERAQP